MSERTDPFETGTGRLRPGELDGSGIIYRTVVDSTNTVARRLAGRGYPGGTTVVAETQTAGRGRYSRAWYSPPGKGLWFSLLLRPPRTLVPAGAAALTLAVAATTASALNAATKVPLKLKWPNDLQAEGQKIAGILIEVKCEPDRVDYMVVGIGINVNQTRTDFPPQLRDRAGSLRLAAGRPFDRTRLFLGLRGKILDACSLYFEQGFAPFDRVWKDLNITLGCPVKVSRPGGCLEGTALDLDRSGALLIRDGQGRLHRLCSGELE